MTTHEKPKKNLIMPVSPMFALIMMGPARHLVKKLCRVKNIQGHDGDAISVVKEGRWALGAVNDNLEECEIKVGTIGMVVGIAEPKTVLRFLVASETGDDADSCIYHLSVLNLEPLEIEQ